MTSSLPTPRGTICIALLLLSGCAPISFQRGKSAPVAQTPTIQPPTQVETTEAPTAQVHNVRVEPAAPSTTKPVAVRPALQRPLRGSYLLNDGNFDPHTTAAVEALGVGRFTVIGQGVVSESTRTGRIDITKLLAATRTMHPNGLHGFVDLDFETPFIGILRTGPSDPRFIATRDHLIDVLRQFKRAYPNTKLTYYNIPALPDYLKTSDGVVASWSSAPQHQRDSFRRQQEALEPLLRELDWFMPRFYDDIPSAQLAPEDFEQRQRGLQQQRSDHLAILRQHIEKSSRPYRPILPVIRSRFIQSSGRFSQFAQRAITQEEFLRDQVAPALNNGANGVCLWSGRENWMLDIAFSPPGQRSAALHENAHALFRSLGVLNRDDKPQFNNAAQKRAFRRALGVFEAKYIALTAQAIRQRADDN